MPRKKIERYATIGFKIRGPFMAPDFIWKDFVGDSKKEASDLGYKYLSAEEIFEEIKNMILY